MTVESLICFEDLSQDAMDFLKWKEQQKGRETKYNLHGADVKENTRTTDWQTADALVAYQQHNCVNTFCGQFGQQTCWFDGVKCDPLQR